LADKTFGATKGLKGQKVR